MIGKLKYSMASRQVNNTSRDITRHLNQIFKRCNKLERSGVKIAVVHSPKKSGGLHVHGNPMITSVIKAHSNEILLNPKWNSNNCYDEHTTTVVLPPLPAPLSSLKFVANTEYMKRFINIRMMKALKLSWKSDNPEWWPSDIPFGHVKTAPSGYRGKHNQSIQVCIYMYVYIYT